MRYLKLFEAFESNKLTKTLGYVDKKSKKYLSDFLRKVCNSIDFPFSELDDSLFNYLSYKKALKYTIPEEVLACDATSKSAFKSSGIEGEKCESGRMKRKWGDNVRNVVCPVCDGTGKKKIVNQLKLVKFWFTKEGEWITTSGTDNANKPRIKKARKGSLNDKISDYIISDEVLSGENIRELKTGDLVLAKLRSTDDAIICYVINNRGWFLVHNNRQRDGNTPPGQEWKSIATHGWEITNGDFHSIQRATLKSSDKEEEEEEEIDPFSWNLPISFNWNGSMFLDKNNIERLERDLKKADFSLVFNISKLKSSVFKRVQSIKSEREEIKKDSRLTVKDSDIKKANIERYMNEISKRSDIVSDITNSGKVVRRMIGGQNILFIMMKTSRFTNYISNIIDSYFKILESVLDENSQYIEYYSAELSKLISRVYKQSSDYSVNVSNNIKDVKKYCKDSGLDKELQIVEGLEQISINLYQKISKMPFDCIEDLDIAKQKIDSFKNMMGYSRYNIDKCDSFISSLSENSSNCKYYLTEHYSIQNDKDSIIRGINQILKIIERF